ncbi:MAG: protoheme IX farnesyltransferase [bacterium]|jgi:protoheme IX farnesyltransferase
MTDTATFARRTPLAGLVLELAKARLTLLVALTAAAGFALAQGAVIDWPGLLWCTLGTALAAGGANALNQWVEASPDGLMRRTMKRPLPSGRMTGGAALGWALAMCAAGVALLAGFSNLLTAALALASILIYVLAYTPMKKTTPVCTLAGALTGAIPPLMGWTAATGGIGLGGLALFAILFVWQIPHFLALGWLYRKDYARAGFKMLSLEDSDGRTSARLAVLYIAALVPLALALSIFGIAGGYFAAASALLGLAFLAAGVLLWRKRTGAAARGVFAASIAYLFLLMVAMVGDRIPADRGADRSAQKFIASYNAWAAERSAPSGDEEK